MRRLRFIPLLVLFACVESPTNEEIANTALDINTLSNNKSLVNTAKSKFAKLEALGIDEVKLTKGFWAERQQTAIKTMIPEMWRIYGDSAVSHALENFKIAAGKKPGQHAGAPFHDGDFYKLIEAASMAYAVSGDEKLNQMIDDVIPLIEASQRRDGYIHTPVMIETINNPSSAKEFRDRMDFESYNMGHLMTAATVHYKATGKTNLLEIAKKSADYLYTYCQKFPDKMALNAICPSHYMGVVEMYRTTGDEKYLELAKQFIDIRGLVTDGTDHNQDRIPFREQTQAVGHAVRANYLYAGVADTYAETGDESLKSALDRIWEDLTQTKLYITGGCGALYDGVSPNGTSYQPSEIQQVHQAYGQAYELPNAMAHNETCANIGSVLWNWRMLQATAEPKYADLLESTLYNSVLSGVNLNGKGYFYTNPLSHQKDLPYQLRWPNVREEYISYSNCCPPNTIRTIVEINNYLYSKSGAGIWLNMYASSEVKTSIGGEELSITQTTNYPWSGAVDITVNKAPSSAKSINFRVPDWCKNATLYVNGSKAARSTGSYITETREWKAGDKLKFEMDMPVTLLEANPLVEDTKNQVAIKRGPVVYCLEANDLPKDKRLSDVLIPADISLKPVEMSIAEADLMALKGTAKISKNSPSDGLYRELNTQYESVPVTLIPYFAWANRDEADMAVWLPVGR